jgi:hypothetical protein
VGDSQSFVVDVRDFAGTGMTGNSAYFVGRPERRFMACSGTASGGDATATVVDELPVGFYKSMCGSRLAPGYLQHVHKARNR